MLGHTLLRTLLLLLALGGIWRASASSPGAGVDRSTPPPGRLSEEVDRLKAALDREAGDAPYVVIDRTSNRLQIRQGGRLLREAVCATGSGRVLYGPKGKLWRFETPRRVFSIQRKVRDPVWAKPEWAFVEIGESQPVLPWAFKRLDVTTLGAYALELGNGFEIHGTLYPALLGRHVTHGCIRLDDEDLETVYSSTEEGVLVYVY